MNKLDVSFYFADGYMKKKMGRPKLPKGEARTEMIRTRVTKSEYETIELAAKSGDYEVSEWVRVVLLKNANKTKPQ